MQDQWALNVQTYQGHLYTVHMDDNHDVVHSQFNANSMQFNAIQCNLMQRQGESGTDIISEPLCLPVPLTPSERSAALLNANRNYGPWNCGST